MHDCKLADWKPGDVEDTPEAHDEATDTRQLTETQRPSSTASVQC